jgi:hypothetical protein
MILRDHGLASFPIALVLLALAPVACAGDASLRVAATAPLHLPPTQDLDLEYHARRRSRGNGNSEPTALLDPTPGLSPVRWPRNSDMRARLLTMEVRNTPLVGWIATNLYRSKRENGWCLEVDPGDGEYVVFYRLHL